jgi:hypothetical protein
MNCVMVWMGMMLVLRRKGILTSLCVWCGEREEEGSVAKPFTSLANAHAPPTPKLIPSAKLSRFWQLIVAFVM